MPSFLSALIRSPIGKNRLTLRLKFWLDTLRGRNEFVFHGRRLRKIPRLTVAPADRKHVLIPTVFFLDRGLAWQTTIAKALEVRGHEVVFMPLDLHFPRRNALYFDEQDHGFITPFYNLYTQTLLRGFGAAIRPYGDFGSTATFEQNRARVADLDETACRAFRDRDLPLGQMAVNPLIHYFRCGPQRMDARMLDAYRDYLAIGMILSDLIERAFDELKPDIVLTLNGSFLDSQLHLAHGRKRNIRVVTFEAGFMLNTLMLGVNEPIISFPMSRYVPPEYAGYRLTAEQNRQLDGYLDSRRRGKENIFDYWGTPVLDRQEALKQLGLPDRSTPDILFTNLLWDSAMLDCDVAFENQLDWIAETIDFYRANPDRTLLIRIHPAEVNPPHLESQDKIEDQVRARFPTLPKNVIVIPATSSISSYPLAELSNLTLVYSSTAGLESVILGKNVLVAGKTHYRDQGFTLDITSKNQYRKLLAEQARRSPDQTLVEAARKYAFFFFFGFMIPFPLVTERPTTAANQVSFNFTDESALLPGRDAGLDFVIEMLLGRTGYADRLRTFIR